MLQFWLEKCATANVLVKRDILIKNFSNLEYEKSHLRKVTSDCFAHEALMLNFVDQSSD